MEMPTTTVKSKPKGVYPQHIIDTLSDEISAAKGYCNMLKTAREKKPGDEFLLKGLCGMIEDEYSHAKFIRYWLEANCIEIPQSVLDEYACMETVIFDCFQKL